jgi:hypothetical protein
VDDPDIGFSRIGPVAVGPDGRIYVSEFQDRTVRIYDADGNLERVIGGPGQGPGELQAISNVGILGDTLWVVDPQGARITFFTPAGELIGTTVASRFNQGVPGQQVLLLHPTYLRADRRWLSEASIGVPIAGLSIVVPELLLLDAAASSADTLRLVRFVIPALAVNVAGVSIAGKHALQDDTLFVNGRERTVVVARPVALSAAESAFTVVGTDVTGDTVFARDFAYHPVAVDDGYVSRTTSAIAERAQGRSSEGQIEAALRMMLPSFHPPVSSARIGQDGAVWLQREDDGSEDHRYLILEPDGEVRGVVRLPRNTVLAWTGTDQIVGVETDALGVPWLVSYRLGSSP